MDTRKKKIIVAAYPKSGSTWLSRLTAEVVGCPVNGFLNADFKEMAQEGEERKSTFEVYKSHHQFHDLSAEDQKQAHIIYLLRDPRDIYLSGLHYFRLHLFPIRATARESIVHKLKRFANKLLHAARAKALLPKRLHTAIVHGNAKLHHWCRVSWTAHVVDYINRPNVLLLKYESLLDEPKKACRAISQFLELEVDESVIDTAIANQSFSNKRELFILEGDPQKLRFLRKGLKEQWKEEQNDPQIAALALALEPQLKKFDYPSS